MAGCGQSSFVVCDLGHSTGANATSTDLPAVRRRLLRGPARRL